MRSEYIFKIKPYSPSEEDKAEIARDSDTDWDSAYKSYKKNLKNYLHKHQNGRCALCRCKIHRGTQYITLEHIASKNKYKQYRALPENLVNACTICNSSKKDKETFSNPSKAKTSFPNKSEDFIIINPYYDNYEDYIEFFDDVLIQAKPGTGDKGKNTIEFYNLTRLNLAEERASECMLNTKNLRHQLMEKLRTDLSTDIKKQIEDIINDLPNWVCS